jgi:hypothetical protein
MTTIALEKVSVEDLAHAFANVLKEWLSDEEMHSINVANWSSDDKSTCASHDFCDANMAMDEAIQKLAPEFYKVAWAENEASNVGDECGPLWSQLTDLFNEAWTLAKNSNFYVGADHGR